MMRKSVWLSLVGAAHVGTPCQVGYPGSLLEVAHGEGAVSLEPHINMFIHFLGGGFMFFLHTEPWGFMIQFDFCIFFKWVGSTTNFRKTSRTCSKKL